MQTLLSETNGTDDETDQTLKLSSDDFSHSHRLLQKLAECFKSCDDGISWFYETLFNNGIFNAFHFDSGSTRITDPLMEMQQTFQELQIELFNRNEILQMEWELHQSITYGMKKYEIVCYIICKCLIYSDAENQ